MPAPTERNTYILFFSVALVLLFWKWQPMGGVMWRVESGAGQAALYCFYADGWLIVLAATFLINHLICSGYTSCA